MPKSFVTREGYKRLFKGFLKNPVSIGLHNGQPSVENELPENGYCRYLITEKDCSYNALYHNYITTIILQLFIWLGVGLFRQTKMINQVAH
ncbi:MAG: hypothetical protein OXI24_21700 [Candidatus Poribacteria bacterium]|nr:hypothetical protein [Candidatus Poribacteria bacterium]